MSLTFACLSESGCTGYGDVQDKWIGKEYRKGFCDYLSDVYCLTQI